jgi:hypothetical protein
LFLPDVFIELIGAEAHGADDRSSNQWIVDAAKQLHNSLFFNNICNSSHHPMLGLYLHMDFNSIK